MRRSVRSLIPPVAGTLITVAFELSVAAGWFQGAPQPVLVFLWLVPIVLWIWWIATHEHVHALLSQCSKFLYDRYGAKHFVLSLFVVIAIGALIGGSVAGAIWWGICRRHNLVVPTTTPAPQVVPAPPASTQRPGIKPEEPTQQIGPGEKGSKEVQRRQALLERLRQEYILSHDNLSPALLAGTEQPPADWVNKRLRELGEKWKVAAPQSSADLQHRTEYRTRLSDLLTEGLRLEEQCKAVPNAYQIEATPQMLSQIADWEQRVQALLSMGIDPSNLEKWRGAILYSSPETSHKVGTMCAYIAVKANALREIMKKAAGEQH